MGVSNNDVAEVKFTDGVVRLTDCEDVLPGGKDVLIVGEVVENADEDRLTDGEDAVIDGVVVVNAAEVVVADA